MDQNKIKNKLEKSLNILERTLNRRYRIGLWNMGARIVINKYLKVENQAIEVGVNTLKYDKRFHDIITKYKCQGLVAIS